MVAPTTAPPPLQSPHRYIFAVIERVVLGAATKTTKTVKGNITQKCGLGDKLWKNPWILGSIFFIGSHKIYPLKTNDNLLIPTCESLQMRRKSLTKMGIDGSIRYKGSSIPLGRVYPKLGKEARFFAIYLPEDVAENLSSLSAWRA